MRTIATVVRSLLASLLVCAASIYCGLLGVVLVIKGTTNQPGVHPIIYLGVGVAAAMTLLGYAISGRAREAIPSVLAILVVGALAQPLTWAVSYFHRLGYWPVIVLLAFVPCLAAGTAGLIQRRAVSRQDAV